MTLYRKAILTISFLYVSASFALAEEGETPYSLGREPWRETLQVHKERSRWLGENRAMPEDLRSDPDILGVNPASRAWAEYQEIATSRSNSAAFAWQPLGPMLFRAGNMPSNKTGGQGRVNCLVFDPNRPQTIYAGSAAGGIWKSTDNAASWQWIAQDDPRLLSISGLAIDPRDSAVLYALTGDGNGSVTIAPSLPSVGVMKSTNGGVTWEKTGLDWGSYKSRYGFKLAIDPRDGDTLFAVTNVGLLRTGDAGVTWSKVLESDMRDFALHPEKSRYAYAATQEEIHFSDDYGKSWKKSDFRPNWGLSDGRRLRRIALAVTPKAPGFVYALVAERTGFVGLFLSQDRGQTFALISNTPNILGYSYFGGDALSVSWYAVTLAVSPIDADDIWVGGVNVWRSVDGGFTWKIKGYYDNLPPYPYIHADIHGLYFQPAQNGAGGRCPPSDGKTRSYHLFAANDAGVFKTEDAGDSWCNLSDGLRITQVYRLCSLSGSKEKSAFRNVDIIYGSQDNGTNGLSTSTAEVVFRGDGAECVFDHFEQNLVYVSQCPGVLVRVKETPSGPEVVSITPPIAASKKPWITPLKMHPENNKELYVCYEDLWRTKTQGRRWEEVSRGRIGSGTCRQIGISKADPKHLYVAKARSVYLSEDGGESWSEITRDLPVGAARITDLEVSPHDPKKACVTLGGYQEGIKVYETPDGGKTWRNISGTLPNVPVHTLLFDSKNEIGGDHRLYVGTDVGVFYRSANCSGEEDCDWIYMEGLPPFIVLDLMTDDQKIQVATFGQGVWESPLEAIPNEVLNVQE